MGHEPPELRVMRSVLAFWLFLIIALYAVQAHYSKSCSKQHYSRPGRLRNVIDSRNIRGDISVLAFLNR